MEPEELLPLLLATGPSAPLPSPAPVRPSTSLAERTCGTLAFASTGRADDGFGAPLVMRRPNSPKSEIRVVHATMQHFQGAGDLVGGCVLGAWSMRPPAKW